MKILKSKKALSPVVASIILIAVTVAVSIAVAAWMGALTLGFTKTENIVLPEASGLEWTSDKKSLNITIRNAQTSLVTITYVKVNGHSISSTNSTPNTAFSIAANTDQEVKIVFNWSAGSNYRIEFVTSNNNNFFKEYTAPSP